MKKHRMLVDGAWVDALSGEWFESLNPFTAAPWALVPRGDKADVDRAVAAAKNAFYRDDWRKLTGGLPICWKRKPTGLRRSNPLTTEN